jgi:hypothetical protein
MPADINESKYAGIIPALFAHPWASRIHFNGKEPGFQLAYPSGLISLINAVTIGHIGLFQHPNGRG